MRMRARLYKRIKRCRWCGRLFDRPPWRRGMLYPTLDHIRPLALGGKNIRSNLTLACEECNTRREARLGPPPEIDIINEWQ